MRFSTTSAFVVTALLSGGYAGYAPVSTACPSTHLVRIAAGISENEATYIAARKAKADIALATWLLKTNPGFTTSGDLPTVAFTSSGGGFRALLTGAGVIKAFDDRDSSLGTSGLYQGLTYHSGVSGGSWLLSSLIANDLAPISSLAKIWKPNFANGVFNPGGVQSVAVYAKFFSDIGSKQAAGFRGTIADAWSRLLSLHLLPGANYGVDNTLSGVTKLSRFVAHEMPYPIITAMNVDLSGTSCIPPTNGSIWEFTPYEFGTWDPEVAAFIPTAYLGTSLSNGLPTSSSCTTNYDNFGFVLGTSSALFNDPTIGIPGAPDVLLSTLCTATPTLDFLALQFQVNVYALFVKIPNIMFTSVADLFATWPNPFYDLPSAPRVSSQKNLAMVDGGESGQVNPIFPFLQPARNVSVILVNDNDANTEALYPDGTTLQNTYLAAAAAGLKRMPFVPSPSVLEARYTSGSPVFFGCHDTSTATIVWIPNAPLTTAGGAIETAKMQVDEAKTDSMIANGIAVGSQNNSAEWATCLGCAIMEGSGTTLPSDCAVCFEKYCFTQ